jgi:flagellar protein FlaI
MFTALDLVSIQTSTRVEGQKVRRNKSLTEINHYDAENDEINVQDVYQWQAETDEYLKMGNSNTLEEIMFDRGWSLEKLEGELFKRQVVLAYLLDEGLNTYAEVAATFQAFINDQETILALIADDRLRESLEDLREMESVQINIEPEKEEMVPRPTPGPEVNELASRILAQAEETLLPEYRGSASADVAAALSDVEPVSDVTVGPDARADTPDGAAADGGAAGTGADAGSGGSDPFAEAMDAATDADGGTDDLLGPTTSGDDAGVEDDEGEAQSSDDVDTDADSDDDAGGFGFGFDDADGAE